MQEGDLDFFLQTAPENRWVWWTIVAQDRPSPGSDPRGIGRPGPVTEWIYIDATTGESVSHCRGASPDPIPCQ